MHVSSVSSHFLKQACGDIYSSPTSQRMPSTWHRQFPLNWQLEIQDESGIGRQVPIVRDKARLVISSLVVAVFILSCSLLIMALYIIRMNSPAHLQPSKIKGGPTFSVMQFNILADYLADNGQPWFLMPLDITEEFRHQLLKKFYTKVEGKYTFNLWKNCFGGLLQKDWCKQVEKHQKIFEWKRRQPRLINTIRSLDADIFSLVELDHYEEFVNEFLDYNSTFAKRPSNRSLDGSSIFWRRARFEAVGNPVHEFFKDMDIAQFVDPEYQWSHDRVMTAIALRDKMTEQILVVVSLHLMKSPEDLSYDAVRVIEAGQAMYHVSCLKDEHNAVGIIVLGDFNAFPGSYTHAFMLHGWQRCDKPDWSIQDAFSPIRRARPKACTSRTVARELWLDYIFYSSGTMSINGQPEVDPCPAEPMPSDQYPSDHLPLKATLQWQAGATIPMGICQLRERSHVLHG